jgi:hypothetical protein
MKIVTDNGFETLKGVVKELPAKNNISPIQDSNIKGPWTAFPQPASYLKQLEEGDNCQESVWDIPVHPVDTHKCLDGADFREAGSVELCLEEHQELALPLDFTNRNCSLAAMDMANLRSYPDPVGADLFIKSQKANAQLGQHLLRDMDQMEQMHISLGKKTVLQGISRRKDEMGCINITSFTYQEEIPHVVHQIRRVDPITQASLRPKMQQSYLNLISKAWDMGLLDVEAYQEATSWAMQAQLTPDLIKNTKKMILGLLENRLREGEDVLEQLHISEMNEDEMGLLLEDLGIEADIKVLGAETPVMDRYEMVYQGCQSPGDMSKLAKRLHFMLTNPAQMWEEGQREQVLSSYREILAQIQGYSKQVYPPVALKQANSMVEKTISSIHRAMHKGAIPSKKAVWKASNSVTCLLTDLQAVLEEWNRDGTLEYYAAGEKWEHETHLTYPTHIEAEKLAAKWSNLGYETSVKESLAGFKVRMWVNPKTQEQIVALAKAEVLRRNMPVLKQAKRIWLAYEADLAAKGWEWSLHCPKCKAPTKMVNGKTECCSHPKAFNALCKIGENPNSKIHFTQCPPCNQPLDGGIMQIMGEVKQLVGAAKSWLEDSQDQEQALLEEVAPIESVI